MASLMERDDIQLGKEMAWHGNTKIQQLITGFPYEIHTEEILRNGVDTGHRWLVCNDTGKTIGNPFNADTYTVLKNSRLVEIVTNALSGTKAEIVSLGTFGNRAKRYITVKLGEDWEKITVGKREFVQYLNIQDAVDKSMPLIAKGSSICIVCANTFGYSLREKGDFKLSIRHSKNMADGLENFELAIDGYRGVTGLYKRLFEDAASTPISEGNARDVFAGFIGQGEEMSTRSVNTVNRLQTLFSVGKGNEGRNVLDVVSAITDFYTHESSGERDDKFQQVESSEIGSGARMKDAFISAIHTDKAGKPLFRVSKGNVAQLAQLGAKSLALSVN